MVVPDQGYALQTVETVLGVLQEQGNKGLDFQDLCRFFHNHIVVLEPRFDEILAGNGGMGARHGNDFRLLHEKVFGAVALPLQDLKRTKFLELRKNILEVPHASLGDFHVGIEIFAFEQRLWRIREKLSERKLFCHGSDVTR